MHSTVSREAAAELLRLSKDSRDSAPPVLELAPDLSVVMLDLEEFQAMSAELRRLRMIQGVRQGMADAAAGRVMTLEESRRLLFEKYGLGSE